MKPVLEGLIALGINSNIFTMKHKIVIMLSWKVGLKIVTL